MPQIRGGEERRSPALDEAPSPAAPTGAGTLHRQHLDRFPERPTDSAIERAARALIRAAFIRLRSPDKAG